jgi:integrase
VKHEVLISTPKTKRGRRTVPIEAGTVEALRDLKRSQIVHAGPGYTGPDWVFRDDAGEPLHPKLVSMAFERFVRKSGLPRIRFHDLRHTFATLALDADQPLATVSTILGHSSEAITADIYMHPTTKMHKEVTDAVASLVLGA